MFSSNAGAKKRRTLSLAKALPVAIAASLLFAGCSAPAADDSSSSSETKTGGAKVAVIGGMASDGFWTIVKNGVEAAGVAVKAAGGEVTWLPLKGYDNLGPDAGDLVRNAIGLGVDAIVIADWVPEAEDPAIKDAIDAGIAVFIYNAGGVTALENTGAHMYIGSDELVAGTAGGAYFAKNGAKNVLCINTTPGSVNQETRCQGLAEGEAANGGKATQLPLPASSFGDPAAIAQAVKGALVADPTIDGVLTIGAQDSDAAASGIEQAGLTGKVKLGTFDLSENVLARIADGTQLFGIDQQPFLQGYMATSMAWQYVQYGIAPTDPVFLTGPALVTADNIKAVQAGVTAGAR